MKIAAIFSDGMVLQRDKVVVIFGESDRDERINITIDNISISDNVSAGAWQIKLPAHEAGGPFVMTVSSTEESIGFEDVLYGEVWLNNGQSNIEFELTNTENGLSEIRDADFPFIRYYNVLKTAVVDETFLKQEKRNSWRSFTNNSFGDVSAVGFYYAVMLYKKLGVPIGLIDCYHGGTSISCWMEYEVLDSMPEGRVYLDRIKEAIKGKTEEQLLEEQQKYDQQVELYKAKEQEIREYNPNISHDELAELIGGFPWPPPVNQISVFRPAGLIETMMKRVVPYTFRGIVYYQGEEDALLNYNEMVNGENTFYKNLLTKMIEEYRKMYHDEKLPVIIIQLPMYIEAGDKDFRDWAYLRESQEAVTREIEGTFLVPLTDYGEYSNVHPINKKTPGERTGMVILNNIYEGNSEKLYPELYDAIKEEDGAVRLLIRGASQGLTLNENELKDIRNGGCGDIFGFEVLVKDSDTEEKWIVPDEIRIVQDNIIIRSSKQILGVRYAFFNYGKVNIYSKNGMPLTQFSVKI